uniref:EF-hand domain-containing protein n=1 Tax=Haptolina ericina TaxID=156174 RepID=A0A7S3BDG9_9EUKA
MIKVEQLVVQLGDHLCKHSILSLLKQWDKDSDGVISKSEFVASMKRMLDVKSDEHDDADDIIGMAFDTIDNDRSGTLDLHELKAEMKKLQERAVKLAAVAAQKAKQAASLRKAQEARQQLEERKTRLEAQLVDLEQQVEAQRGEQPLAVKLGQLLEVDSLSVADWMKKWDKDGDGKISRVEFRYRSSSLGLREHEKDLESLFDRLDKDGSGSIDLSELDKGLRSLQKAVGDSEARKLQDELRLQALREQLASVANAQEAGVKADQADQAIEDMRQSKGFFGRLGDVVKNKNINVWLREWDRDNDGTISRLEFHHHIRTLGIPCSDAELDDTYNGIDRKGESTLMITHLRDYLKLVLEKNLQTIKEEEKHLKQAQSLRRQAERLRLEEAAKDAMEAEKKEAEAAAALRTAEEEQQLEKKQAEERKRSMEELKAAKEAKEKREKKEFDERVERARKERKEKEDLIMAQAMAAAGREIDKEKQALLRRSL